MHGHKEVVEFLITAGAYVFNEQNALQIGINSIFNFNFKLIWKF